MAVAANADDYANDRLNIFFPGLTPDLDGQCVSLVKWFMQEMSNVPDPQAARGDARYVGQTLVNQGHAVEINWADRKRGDIVCYEYGTYGHIGVILSGNRTFEENVNWSGVASKTVDGATVYASRIGDMAEAWRTGKNPHIYRLNTYTEGDPMGVPTEAEIRSQFMRFAGIEPTAKQITDYQKPENGWGALNGDLLQYNFDRNPPMNTGDLTNLFGELGITNPVNDNDIEYHMNQNKGGWNHAFYDLVKRTDRERTTADANFVEDCAVGTLGHTAVGDVDLQNNVGGYKSAVLRTFVNYPEAQAFRAKAAAGGSGGIDQATKDEIDNTNSIVQKIWDKISSIFK